MTGPLRHRFAHLRLVAPAACLLAILPVLAAHHLPLLDAQGHESRLVALRDILLSPRGSPFYDFAGFLLPNVAFDIVGIGLVGCVGPEAAGRIFFALTLVLTLTGAWVLNRVSTGRWSWTPLAATLFLYNLVTVLGFFSYAFGFALVLWALAGWRMLAGRSRLLFGSLAGIVLVFCHVFDFGLYGVMVAGFIVSDAIGGRTKLPSAAMAALTLVPGVVAYALMTHGAGGEPRFERRLLAAKLFGLVKSVTCASMTGDIAFVAGAFSLTVLIAAARKRRLAPGFALGLAALAVLYVLLPDKLATGSYVDKRLPIAIALLFLAGLDLDIGRARLATIMVCLIGSAILTKQIALAVLWRSFDPVIDAIARPLDSLPAGSIVLQAECEPDANRILSVYRERQPSLTHVPAMSAFSDSRFVAATWAISGQHSVSVKAAYRAYYDLQESFGSSTCSMAGYRQEYDAIADLVHENEKIGPRAEVFFLLIRPTEPDPLPRAETVAVGDLFTLYHVE